MKPAVLEVVDRLFGMPGVVAVALGGSRAAGTADASSDWDLGVYYRGRVELAALAELGEVHPPGAWGRMMNGGAWLTVGGEKVDVLLRDLDVVEAWSAKAARGEFEIDALLGYLAGVPTYYLLGERAVGRALRGELADAGAFPEKLAEAAPPRWRFCRDFSLAYAEMHGRRGDVIGAVGQAAKAVMEEAHARLAERREWALNEKRMVERAGLSGAQAAFAGAPDPLRWIAGLRAELRGKA